MTYDNYELIKNIALIVFIVLFVLSVVLFFTLRIYSVIGDLSGRTAKKAIQRIREQNSQSGDKTYRTSAINKQRGKITEPISGSLPQKTSFGTRTAKISTAVLSEDARTAMNETSVLNQEAETNETTVLAENMDCGATTVLDETLLFRNSESEGDGSFGIEKEITFIHSNEVIGVTG